MGLEEKTVEREIEGRMFRAWPMAWGIGRPALVKLMGILSPVLSGVFRGGTPGEATAAVFDALPSALSDADLTYFAKAFGDASHVKVGDQWVPLVEQNQSTQFAADYLGFFRWLVFCAEVNFGGFFAGVMKGGSGAEFLKKIAVQS